MKNVTLSLKACLLACVVLFAVSCKDDEAKPSKTDLLTAKPWKLAKIELKTNDGTFDITDDLIEECLKDNLFTFKKDGSTSTNVGADDCDGDDEDSAATWSWKENETVLLIIPEQDLPQTITVIELTSTSLKVDIGKEMFDMDGDNIDETEGTLIQSYTN